MPYTFNGVDLETSYNLIVESIDGNLSFPQRKMPTEVSFSDSHGASGFTDFDDIKYEPRNINIRCTMHDTSKANFLNRLEVLKAGLKSAGLGSLILKHDYNTYSVYYRDESILTRVTPWNDKKNFGTFTLVFREPESSCPALWKGLIGHWVLNSTLAATDQSEFGNDGVLTNTNYTTDRKTTSNGAMEFDGTEDLVTIGDISKNAKTIALWMYVDDNTSRDIIDLDGGTHLLTLDGSGDLQATGFSSPTIYLNDTESQAVSNSTWYLVIVTTSTSIDVSDLVLGKSTSWFDGRLHNVKLWDRQLSAIERKLLYNQYNGNMDL